MKKKKIWGDKSEATVSHLSLAQYWGYFDTELEFTL